jgi:hypothetical protein
MLTSFPFDMHLQVHMQYLEAGADVIISSSYQVFWLSSSPDIDHILEFMVAFHLKLEKICLLHVSI